MAWIKRLSVGFLSGVGVDYILAIIVSTALDLGYFMPCLAAMPELVGGEMNAVILQALAFGLLGGGIAAACRIAKAPGCPARCKSLLIITVLLLAALPVAALAALLLGSR